MMVRYLLGIRVSGSHQATRSWASLLASEVGGVVRSVAEDADGMTISIDVPRQNAGAFEASIENSAVVNDYSVAA